MKTIHMVLGVALLGLCVAVAQQKAPVQLNPGMTATAKPQTPQTSTAKMKGKSKAPIVGYLEGRGKTIIIKVSSKGPIYSVQGADGKLLFEDLTAEQLRVQAPEVHDFIKSAVAVNTRQIDASLRRIR